MFNNAYNSGKKIIISNEQELRDFVSESIIGKGDTRTVAYGRVSDSLAKAVYEASDGNINIKGYFLELTSNDVKHAYDTHHMPKRDTNLPMSEDDMVRAIQRVNSAKLDKIEYHKDNSNALQLHLEDTNGDTVIIEVVSLSAGSLKFKTAWREDVDKKRNSVNTIGNKNSNSNSKLDSMRDTSASEDSIAHESTGNQDQFSDRDYLDAVNRGDMETAQKMVDEVAKAHGYTTRMYHGSDTAFTKFDKSKIRAVDYDAPFNGFWFSSSEDTSPAMHNAEVTREFYLDISNPAPYQVWRKVSKEVDKEWFGEDADKYFHEESRSTNDEIRYRLQDMGYDSIHWDGIPDVDWDTLHKDGTVTFRTPRGSKYQLEMYWHNEDNSDLGWMNRPKWCIVQQHGKIFPVQWNLPPDYLP